MFFDRHGRCLPSPLITSRVCDANRNFHIFQPTLDYAERHARLTECLGELSITAAEFAQRSDCVIAQLRENPQTANALKDVFLPIIAPRLIIKDLGTCLEEILLPAVRRSYTQQFPRRPFISCSRGDLVDKVPLVGQVSLVAGTRHEQLVADMAQSPVVGIFLPNPLQGFSVQAQREQVAAMPKEFVLSALDTFIAMIMYPDVLARNSNIIGLDCSALQWQSVGWSLHFKAIGSGLGFNNGSFLSDPNGSCSGGFIFLG